jgi:hypothetical protein
LRYVEHDRDVKPSTLSDYRHMARRLDRDFGETPLERISTDAVERGRPRRTHPGVGAGLTNNRVQAAISAGSICAATTRSGGTVTVTTPSRSKKKRTLTNTIPMTAPDSS